MLPAAGGQVEDGFKAALPSVFAGSMPSRRALAPNRVDFTNLGRSLNVLHHQWSTVETPKTRLLAKFGIF
jgi:hypothetical protein